MFYALGPWSWPEMVVVDECGYDGVLDVSGLWVVWSYFFFIFTAFSFWVMKKLMSIRLVKKLIIFFNGTLCLLCLMEFMIFSLLLLVLWFHAEYSDAAMPTDMLDTQAEGLRTQFCDSLCSCHDVAYLSY